MLTFRKGKFANPEALATYLVKHKTTAKLQADHKLLFKGDWELAEMRLAEVRRLASDLAGLIPAKQAAV